ncbi:hypothetical protein [Gloeocapsopsis dulcis]|uniref:hypothetical protein n=1 Tax=Gloeocapsopsis dulcis TaxID=2859516 RepID=UPI00101AE9F0|nr:hypothetical protein [Gloeocapsopsis dulcis]WNN91546.1 hypothetical protein P0S91_10925 [Gloeocapsopsis dulcis]
MSGAIASGNITQPNTSFIQNSLTELPANVIDPSILVANSCIARSDHSRGSFIITGTGGLHPHALEILQLHPLNRHYTSSNKRCRRQRRFFKVALLMLVVLGKSATPLWNRKVCIG